MSEAVTRIQQDQKSVLLERLIDANPTVFADLRNVLRIVKDASFYTANDAFDGIVVNRKLCNKAEFTEWDLAKYRHLKGICVLDYSLENTQSLSLSPCAELEKLIICSHCFENGTGSFVVDACHCLKSVEIGSFSFQKFSSFSLRDSSLQTVAIGDNSVSSCSVVVLEGFFLLFLFTSSTSQPLFFEDGTKCVPVFRREFLPCDGESACCLFITPRFGGSEEPHRVLWVLQRC